MPRKDCERREAEIRKAIDHPLRLRILEMHKRGRGLDLSLETLTTALAQTQEYKGVTAAEVKYHRDRLLDAELLRSERCRGDRRP